MEVLETASIRSDAMTGSGVLSTSMNEPLRQASGMLARDTRLRELR
jgi:hypothetical protein